MPAGHDHNTEPPKQDHAPKRNHGSDRARGRGRSRGGLGKYLRARGRGQYAGRPAVFQERLLLEGEGKEEGDEETNTENAIKYSRRQLGSNANRYLEPEPELGPDGKPVVEPEVDLSAFLERQRLSDSAGPDEPMGLTLPDDIDTEDADTSIKIIGRKGAETQSRRGKVTQINWDKEFEELHQLKESADAARDLKSRFRSKSEKYRVAKPTAPHRREKDNVLPPPLPSLTPPLKSEREQMQDFLDELLK